MSISGGQKAASKYYFSLTVTRVSKKWLIPILGKKFYKMSLDYHITTESKASGPNYWDYVKKN